MNRRQFLLSAGAATASGAFLVGPADRIIGGDWTISPAEMLDAARREFEDAASRALAGDVAAIESVGPLSTRYTNLAYPFHGPSEDFVRIFMQVQNTLYAVADTLPEA